MADEDDLDSLLADLEGEESSNPKPTIAAPVDDERRSSLHDDDATNILQAALKKDTIISRPFDDTMQEYIDEMTKSSTEEDPFARRMVPEAEDNNPTPVIPTLSADPEALFFPLSLDSQ